MIQDTSIEAWSTSDFEPDRKRVYDLVLQSQVRGLTLFEAARKMGKPDNRISGRFTELRDEGLIHDSGRRAVNPETGKRAIVWTVTR